MIEALWAIALFAGILIPLNLQAGQGNGSVTGKVLVDDRTSAIVYITDFEEAADATPLVLKQKDKKFVPQVLPIVKGQVVEFRNDDLIRHNVFSVSSAQSFDLGLTSPGDAPRVTFNHSGVIEVYCNIHPEMVSTLLVLPNRAYAMTSPEGTYRIDGVPAGKHTIYVWHRLAKAEHQIVEVKAGKEAVVNWKMSKIGAFAPHLNKFGRPYKDNQKY